jgi:hypothetical protein
VAKGNNELITSWASCVKGMAFYLEDIGGMVTDKDIIDVLTMGLNKEYDHFVASIDATLMQELTVDYGVTRMLNEEAWYGEKGKGSIYANEALVANIVNAKPRTDYNEKSSGRKCWRCGETNHVRSECNVPSDVRCGNCGKKGHTMEACLKPRGAEDTLDTAAMADFVF